MLTLRAAVGASDRIQALRDGSVASERIRLEVTVDELERIFRSILSEGTYDIGEMSLASYVIERSRGRDDLIALPVFPSRMFRHSSVYVPSASERTRMEDLAGARIGVPDYQMTAAVWVRWALARDHGVAWQSNRWFVGGLETPDRGERVRFIPPSDTSIERVDGDRTLVHMLLDGELDAILSPKTPTVCTEDGPIRRLLDDPRAAELAHYRRNGIVPIMHTIVMRHEIYDASPWSAQELFALFEAARRRAMDALWDTDGLQVSLLWLPAYVREQAELFGPDPWAYGLAPNRRILETFIDACAEQGLLSAIPTVDDLFPMHVDARSRELSASDRKRRTEVDADGAFSEVDVGG